MDHLDELENESIYIIREAYNQFKNIAVLWSMGKDSSCLLWLIKKAFFGHCPTPVIHIDTTYKIPEMIKWREEYAKKWNLNLIVGKNEEALRRGMHPDKGKVICCEALKTIALQKLMKKEGFTCLILGIRRDEEGTRAKERFFSIRDKEFMWNFKDQPPELWDQFNTDFEEGMHVRVHPLLHWTEIDVWKYIQREKIPIIDLYFAKNEKRYRSLGCKTCTSQIESNATTIAQIIKELKSISSTERAGRAQDQEDTYAMQKLRARGYM